MSPKPAPFFCHRYCTDTLLLQERYEVLYPWPPHLAVPRTRALDRRMRLQFYPPRGDRKRHSVSTGPDVLLAAACQEIIESLQGWSATNHCANHDLQIRRDEFGMAASNFVKVFHVPLVLPSGLWIRRRAAIPAQRNVLLVLATHVRTPMSEAQSACTLTASVLCLEPDVLLACVERSTCPLRKTHPLLYQGKYSTDFVLV